MIAATADDIEQQQLLGDFLHMLQSFGYTEDVALRPDRHLTFVVLLGGIIFSVTLTKDKLYRMDPWKKEEVEARFDAALMANRIIGRKAVARYDELSQSKRKEQKLPVDDKTVKQIGQDVRTAMHGKLNLGTPEGE